MIVRELVARFGFQTDLSGLDKADKRINSTKNDVKGLGTALQGAFAGLAAYGVGQKVNEAVDASNRFGEALGKIQSLIPGNTQRAKEYRRAIEDLALSTGQSLGDVAAGAYDVVSTFGDTRETIDQLNLAVKVGAAGAATTKDGIALLSGVTKAYGDTSAAAMQKVADLGFQTVNLGKIELPQLASSIVKATPLAAALGVNMEEVFAVMARGTGVTAASGDEVATQIDSVLRSMTQKTPEMAKAFKKAGFQGVNDAIGKKGMVGALRVLVAQTDGTSEGIEKLFGRIEGLKLALDLTGKGAADFDDKLKVMNNAAGATDTAFAAMRGGLAANATQAKKTEVAIEQLKVKIGDDLSGSVNNLQRDLLNLVNLAAGDVHTVFVNMSTDAENSKTAIDNLKGAVQPLVSWFAKLALIVDSVGGGIGKTGDKLEDFKNKVADIIAKRSGISSETLLAQWGGRGASTEERKERDEARIQRMKALSEYIVDPEAARNRESLNEMKAEVEAQRQKSAQARQTFTSAFESGAPVNWDQTIGQINVNLEIPQERTVPQITNAVQMGLSNALKRAANANPNRANKTGTGVGVGPAGTNSTMGNP